MRKLIVLLSALAVALMAIAPSFAQEEPGTIVDVVLAANAAETPEFTILAAAVLAADPAFAELASEEDAGITVFAPTDAAFTAAFEALGLTPEEVLADQALLNMVLAYHIVPYEFYAEDVVELDGAYIGTFLPDAALMVSVSEDGSTVMINDATVAAADVEASNGVIHVIDTVLLPPMPEDDMMMATEEPGMEEPGTLADIVVAATSAETPEFTVLLTAVASADPGFVEAAGGDQPLTVFAPTDAAFAAAFEALGIAPEDLLADLETLNMILAYHIVPGSFSSAYIAELAGMSEDGTVMLATALSGYAITITVSDAGVTVDEANVVQVDIMGSNGVIHVLDGVLMPMMEE